MIYKCYLMFNFIAYYLAMSRWKGVRFEGVVHNIFKHGF